MKKLQRTFNLLSLLFFLSLFLSAFSPSAFSWLQESEYKNGRRNLVRWPLSVFPLKLTFALPGTADIDGLREFDALRRAAQQWDHLPTANISFQLGVRNSPDVNASDHINTLLFREDSDPSLVAKTILTFVTSTGEIQDADIVFNERFSFKVDRPSPSASTSKEIFLEDVAVHELGHLLGSTHSPTYLSSMWFATLAGQSFPDADDRAFASHLYPKGNYRENRIGGKITDSGGRGIFGASVSAIETAEGGMIGESWSAVTDFDGSYVIEGVPDGAYVLIIQPLYGSLSNIYGKYFGTSQNPNGRVADGANSESDFKERYFGRNLSSRDSLFLDPIEVEGGISATGVDLKLTSPSESISDAENENNNTTASATPLSSGGAVAVGRLESSDTVDLYKIASLAAGDVVTARVVAYTLRSPLDSRLKFFEGEGATPTATSEDIAASATRFHPKNLDPFLFQYEVQQDGPLFIAVERVKPLAFSDFSGGFSLSATEHYLLIVSVERDSPPTFGEGDLALLSMQEDQPARRLMREGGAYGIDRAAVDWGIFEEISFRGGELTIVPRKDQGDVAGDLFIFREEERAMGWVSRRWGILPVTIEAVNDAPFIAARTLEIENGKKGESDITSMFTDVESNGSVGGLGSMQPPVFKATGTGELQTPYVSAILQRRGDAVFVSVTAKQPGTIGEPVRLIDDEGLIGEGLLTFRVVEPGVPGAPGPGGGFCGRIANLSDTPLNIALSLLLWSLPFGLLFGYRSCRRRKQQLP